MKFFEMIDRNITALNNWLFPPTQEDIEFEELMAESRNQRERLRQTLLDSGYDPDRSSYDSESDEETQHGTNNSDFESHYSSSYITDSSSIEQDYLVDHDPFNSYSTDLIMDPVYSSLDCNIYHDTFSTHF